MSRYAHLAPYWHSTGRDLESPLFADMLRRSEVTLRGKKDVAGITYGAAGYGDAGAFNSSYRETFTQISGQIWSPYESVANAFVLNMDRVGAMYMLPNRLIHSITKNTQMYCAAASSVGIPIEEALSIETQTNEAFKVALNELMRAERELKLSKVLPSDHEQAKTVGPQHLERLIQSQVEQLGMLVSSEDQLRSWFTIGGVEATMFAMITASFAAFETFAIDLWVTALNHYPQAAINWCSDKPDRTLTLSQLARFGFDLSGSMGTALAGLTGDDEKDDVAKARFDRLRDIWANYQGAFGSKASSCWDPDDEIQLASSVRNLLAHRGGLIDRRFLKRAKRCPEYANQALDERLKSTGALVARHIDACTSVAEQLLIYVVKWSKKHDKKAGTRRLGDDVG